MGSLQSYKTVHSHLMQVGKILLEHILNCVLAKNFVNIRKKIPSLEKPLRCSLTVSVVYMYINHTQMLELENVYNQLDVKIS